MTGLFGWPLGGGAAWGGTRHSKIIGDLAPPGPAAPMPRKYRGGGETVDFETT